MQQNLPCKCGNDDTNQIEIVNKEYLCCMVCGETYKVEDKKLPKISTEMSVKTALMHLHNIN